MLYDYLQHAKGYYNEGSEYQNVKLAIRPVFELYGSSPADKFGATEFKAIREWWLSNPIQYARKKKVDPKAPKQFRSRQYVNKCMNKLLRVFKWAVATGMFPAANFMAIKCIEPLKRGRCGAREAKAVKPVCDLLVEQTMPHLTPVLQAMVKFQRLTGCRPGELVRITPAMVNRSRDVWAIELADHKTAYRGKERFIYVGPQAQAVLLPYLLRESDKPSFSPIESEKQRLAAKHESRKIPLSCGNRPGTNRARKPRKAPGEAYSTGTYAKAIKYCCGRNKLTHWHPNQLRHSAATQIRKEHGIDAASVVLGHSGLAVTQVYAEQDRAKAMDIARSIG